jgi:hypothetical protein
MAAWRFFTGRLFTGLLFRRNSFFTDSGTFGGHRVDFCGAGISAPSVFANRDCNNERKYLDEGSVGPCPFVHGLSVSFSLQKKSWQS